MNTFKSFFKDTAVYGLASVLPKVIVIGLVAIHTEVFKTVEFSFMTTWYVYAAFINIILTLGLETSFFRFYTAESDKKMVISTSFTLLLISSLTLLFAGYLFSGSLCDFFGFNDDRYLSLLLWITVLDTLSVIPFAYLRVINKSFRFLIIKLSNVITLAFFTVFFLIILPKYEPATTFLHSLNLIPAGYKPQVLHIFIANLFASFITLVLLLPELGKMTISIDRVLLKKLMHYGIPIMIGGIAYAVNEHLDKLMIPALIDENANGIYAACYKLGVFMTLYITAFRMGAEPFFFNNAHLSDAKEKYSTIMISFVTFGSMTMLLVIVLIDPISHLFIRQHIYLEGLYIVPVILLANLFSGVYANLSVWYKLTDQTRFGMYISIFGGILTIISLLILIPPFGISGAAYATLFTYLSMAVISWYFGSRYYSIPYDIPKIMLIIGTGAMLSLLSFHFFRGHYLINIIICTSYMIFLYLLLKKEIRQILS